MNNTPNHDLPDGPICTCQICGSTDLSQILKLSVTCSTYSIHQRKLEKMKTELLKKKFEGQSVDKK